MVLAPGLSIISTSSTTRPGAPVIPHPVKDFLQWALRGLNLHNLIRENTALSWIWLLGCIFLGLFLGKLLSVGAQRMALRLEGRRWHLEALLLDGLCSPIKIAIFGMMLSIGFWKLTLDPMLQGITYRAIFLIIDIAVFWYIFNIVSIVEHVLKRAMSQHESNFTDQFVPLVRKTLRVFIFIVGTLYILQNVFEKDIGSWLAGLGIAGLAVSLAAQDSLKNLFGTLTIFLDRPFLVGQWINYQSYSGNVEEIGLRSTRLRLFDGSMVSIPNSDIVNNPLQNYANRPYIRRTINLTIPYDTPAPKIREALEIIRNLCKSPEFSEHIHMSHTPGVNIPRAFFSDFGSTALTIVAYYYFHPGTDWWSYMEFNERFNIALFEAYEKAGIEFSFPTQTLYLAGDAKRKLTLEMLRADVSDDKATEPVAPQ